MLKRFKNYGFWISLAAFIPVLADALGIYNINIILPGNYDKLVSGLLGLFVLLGLVNNPATENKGFGDDKE